MISPEGTSWDVWETSLRVSRVIPSLRTFCSNCCISCFEMTDGLSLLSSSWVSVWPFINNLIHPVTLLTCCYLGPVGFNKLAMDTMTADSLRKLRNRGWLSKLFFIVTDWDARKFVWIVRKFSTHKKKYSHVLCNFTFWTLLVTAQKILTNF